MQTRRQILAQGAAVGGLAMTGGLLPQSALAFNAELFKIYGFDRAVEALGAKSAAELSREVTLRGPDIAENGEIVQFSLGSEIDGVKQLALMVDKNPDTLSAVFDVNPAIEPMFTTRTKMQETSTVYAVAITEDGRAFYAQKDVKVTFGGCGG